MVIKSSISETVGVLKKDALYANREVYCKYNGVLPLSIMWNIFVSKIQLWFWVNIENLVNIINIVSQRALGCVVQRSEA